LPLASDNRGLLVLLKLMVAPPGATIVGGGAEASAAAALGLLQLVDRSSLRALERDPDLSSPEDRAPSERSVLTPESEPWSVKSLPRVAAAEDTMPEINVELDDEVEEDEDEEGSGSDAHTG
jgi:hypothetical protein